MVIDLGLALRYYKKKEVQEELVKAAQGKEIGVRFNNKFGKRPDVLVYPQDVLEVVKKGATSFHCSEEIWDNPLDLYTGITKKELNQLRSGWDLILDIDCAIFEYSRICADLVVKFLKYSGVKDVSAKFSVTGDTPVLIRVNGQSNLVSIKEAIDLFKTDNKLEIYL